METENHKILFKNRMKNELEVENTIVYIRYLNILKEK